MINKVIETARRYALEKESLSIPKDYVIISITNPNDRQANLDHLGVPIFRFAFDDMDEASYDYPSPITDSQAKKILEVLRQYDKIIVHCEMAYSRSPAVAKFAAENLGFKWVTRDIDNSPNKRVLRKLKENF